VAPQEMVAELSIARDFKSVARTCSILRCGRKQMGAHVGLPPITHVMVDTRLIVRDFNIG
jgi:hypothetical protein